MRTINLHVMIQRPLARSALSAVAASRTEWRPRRDAGPFLARRESSASCPSRSCGWIARERLAAGTAAAESVTVAAVSQLLCGRPGRLRDLPRLRCGERLCAGRGAREEPVRDARRRRGDARRRDRWRPAARCVPPGTARRSRYCRFFCSCSALSSFWFARSAGVRGAPSPSRRS